MFVHGTFNAFGYDDGLRHTMKQDQQGIWKFDFMTEWPTVFQLNVWGINPDGTPDLTRVFGDPDYDGILDRLSPVSLLENVVNVTAYPPSPFVAYQIAANDGSLRYVLMPIGRRSNQMIIYFLLMFIPVASSFLGIWLYQYTFYTVKFNTAGRKERRSLPSLLPTSVRESVRSSVRSSLHVDKYIKRWSQGFFKREEKDSPTTEVANYDSVDAFVGAPTNSKRRVVLIATMEYDIEDWGIKIKIGGLGVMAQL